MTHTLEITGQVLSFPEPVCDSFGTCPVCGRHDGYLNVGPQHWFYCKRHKTKWLAGSNLFSGWRTEDPIHHSQNAAYLSGFKDTGAVT